MFRIIITSMGTVLPSERQILDLFEMRGEITKSCSAILILPFSLPVVLPAVLRPERQQWYLLDQNEVGNTT